MELDNITGNLVDARHRLAEATTLLNQINELRGAPISEYGSIPAVLSDPGVRSARETQARAQARVSELAERYGPMHPTMVSAKSELDEANRTLTEQVRDVISSVRRQYEVSRAKVDELTAALASTKQDVSNINSKQANLHALEREVENNRQLYDIFVTRLKEANVTSDMQSANARVIDSATVSSVPVKPKKALIILATFFLGLTGSTFLSFLTEALDNTLKFSADVEQKLHLQVLGLLPKLPGKLIGGKLRSIRYYTGHNEGIFAENIRTVRTNILLNNYDEKKKMIVITSSIQGEGKSTLAVNLALSLAYLGKTLLIDADMRHPIVAKIFKLKHRQAIGLSDFIADGLPANKCIQDLHDEGLFVMPAGTPPPNPQELLSSDRFRQAIPLLRNSFDYIVIDSAPIIPVSDAVILSGYVDEVIYVVKANDTPYHLAQEGIKLLNQVEAPITGVVLNQVSLSNNVGPYGYYLADYYRTSGYLNQTGSNSV
jgi:capsular exopolysaccharide synthesis family protein